MRILHVTPYYRDAWAYGGIPRLAAAAAEALARRGHEVTVATTDACNRRARLPGSDNPVRGPERPALRGGEVRALRGVDVVVFPNLSNALAARLQFFTPRGLDAWLRAHAPRFDVAHIHGCRHLPGAIAARRLRAAGVPYVLQPNGTAPIIERRQMAKRIFDATIGRGVAPNAARIVAVSAAEERQLAALSWNSRRVRRVANGVDVAEFEGPSGETPGRDRPSDPLILYLGQLTPRKHVDVLVRALAQLQTLRARLAIAGADMGAGAAVDAWTRRLHLQPRVTRLGVLEGAARLTALAGADVVAYAGRDEIFGLVAVEALLCGTPVVVANDSGCGEIVSTFGGGLLVPPGDEDALAAALDRILSAPGEWRDAAARAAPGLRGWCGADQVAQALESVYAEVALRALHGEPASAHPRAVSFVVPVLNGERHLDECLDAIARESAAIAHEVLVVDDGSDDRSPEIVWRAAQANPRIRRLDGERRGAAAAINLGIRSARHPIICQIDQDVVIQPGWLGEVLRALEQRDVAAAQGIYVPRPAAGPWARVAALDLLDRYGRRAGRFTDHVCTGNTAYRAEALHQVKLLDESLGYGYDNDLSYRLGALGHRLAICRTATATHAWREGTLTYLRQQYGVGYGRLDVVARHRRRWRGDSVSGAGMIAHAALMLVAVLGVALASTGALLHVVWKPWLALAALVLAALALERAVAGARVAGRFRDRAGWLFAPIHLLRDVAWAAAIGVWTARRLAGRGSRAAHSMTRAARRWPVDPPPPADAAGRVVIVIPAYNEAQNLPHVLDELRRVYPAARPVVVDDGSTDETPEVLEALGVEHLRLGVRLGVGGAVKAGLRYARSLGAVSAVRMDGDGQHRPEDVVRLMAPILAGDADVTVGSRYVKGAGRGSPPQRAGVRVGDPGAPPQRAGVRVGDPGPGRRVLAATLSALTRSRVTDPTSGLWAFGPRAVRLLAQHHPTGYAEPELRLLVARNGLRVRELPIAVRERRAGRTSITTARAGLALARTLLALVIVPLRATQADE